MRQWVKDRSFSAFKVDIVCLRCAKRTSLGYAWIDPNGPAFKAYYCQGCYAAINADDNRRERLKTENEDDQA